MRNYNRKVINYLLQFFYCKIFIVASYFTHCSLVCVDLCVCVCVEHDYEPYKMTPPIKLPFGIQTWVGPRYHILGDGAILEGGDATLCLHHFSNLLLLWGNSDDAKCCWYVISR